MNTGQESKSTIMDNLNSLSTPQTDNSNVESSTECEKTFTVTDIVNKRINSLESYLDTKVINIYQRPWSKLEQKLKLKKLDEYYNNGPVNQDSSEDDEVSKKKKKKYVEAFNNYSHIEIKHFLNTSEKRRVKVEYDDIDCKINSILVSS
jgi:hypothetical protein